MRTKFIAFAVLALGLIAGGTALAYTLTGDNSAPTVNPSVTAAEAVGCCATGDCCCPGQGACCDPAAKVAAKPAAVKSGAGCCATGDCCCPGQGSCCADTNKAMAKSCCAEKAETKGSCCEK